MITYDLVENSDCNLYSYIKEYLKERGYEDQIHYDLGGKNGQRRENLPNTTLYKTNIEPCEAIGDFWKACVAYNTNNTELTAKGKAHAFSGELFDSIIIE